VVFQGDINLWVSSIPRLGTLALQLSEVPSAILYRMDEPDGAFLFLGAGLLQDPA